MSSGTRRPSSGVAVAAAWLLVACLLGGCQTGIVTGASRPLVVPRRRQHLDAPGRLDRPLNSTIPSPRCKLLVPPLEMLPNVSLSAEFFADTGATTAAVARYGVARVIFAGWMSSGVAFAVDRQSGERVAIKKFGAVKDRNHAATVFKEVTIHKLLTELIGTRVVPYKDILVPRKEASSENSVLLVMEKMDTTLADKWGALYPMDMKIKKLIAYQMLAAVRDMHHVGYVHGDLQQSGNFFLQRDCTTKLGDFGITRTIKDGSAHHLFERLKMRLPMPGTVPWRDGYLPAADVWQVGRALLNLGSGVEVFYQGKRGNWSVTAGTKAWLLEYGLPPPEIAERLHPEMQAEIKDAASLAEARTMEELFPRVPPEMMRFVKRLLSWDLLRLPTAAELLRDPFFDDIRSDPLIAEPDLQKQHHKKFGDGWRAEFHDALRHVAS